MPAPRDRAVTVAKSLVRGRARTALKHVHGALLTRQTRRDQDATLLAVTRSTSAAEQSELLDRMQTLLRALGRPVPEAAAHALCEAVDAAMDDADAGRVWLALAVLSGRLPLDGDVLAARRRLRIGGGGAALGPALARSWLTPDRWRSGTVEVVTELVVVDVDYTAKHDTQTGIQRVVRQLLPRWHRDHEVRLAVWTDEGDALRRPHGDELERVLAWAKPLHRPALAHPATVLVPWHCTVVLPEVPGIEQCSRLATLARFSGNWVTAVGHDCIPVFSADLMPLVGEPNRFARYLSLVKHLDVLAGVSASAAREFRAVAKALPSQGLPGPRVLTCPLATAVAAADTLGALSALRPGITEALVVGSHDPRKNHLAVLHAAEVLWREGLRFHLRFIGARGWTTEEFDCRIDVLTRAGRPVADESIVDDEALWAAYRRARFTVFPSLHEGYGLPVAESLAFGTPVLGTSYGSVAELADHGGMVLVDPRDDDALIDAMRALLVDDELVQRLREAARERPRRTWDDYALELWDLLAVRPTAIDSAEPELR